MFGKLHVKLEKYFIGNAANGHGSKQKRDSLFGGIYGRRKVLVQILGQIPLTGVI